MKKTLKQNIIKGGVHLGHKSTKYKFQSPYDRTMTPFLKGKRFNLSIYNLQTTFHYLLRALSVIALVIQSKGTLLIINADSDYYNYIQYFSKKIGKQLNISFCNCKWVGGTLTNWILLRKYVYNFGRFSRKYNSFFQYHEVHVPLYLKRKKGYQGLVESSISENNVRLFFKRKPDIVFIVNPNENYFAIQEAAKLKIPIIAITESNTNISQITYPIPANNNTLVFLHFCFFWISRILSNIKK